MNTPAAQNEKPENGLLNILFNIALPVLILNKASDKIGPLPALILALAFPLGYGAYDYVQRRKTNFFSILGLLNVALTGGLALSGLTGIWFAVKEAAFPALIGVFVFGSAFTKKPFIETLFLNPQVIKMDVIEQKLMERQQHDHFHRTARHSTMLLAGSFLISAVLNFALAASIFTPLAGDDAAQSLALNEQIAKMTSLSMVVIMVPSVIILMGIFWYLLRGIRHATGLTLEEIMKS